MTRPESCGPHPCGTRPAYEIDGCRKDSCRLMMVLHTKHDPAPVETFGVKLPAEPYARIIRALLRAGYTIAELAQRADLAAPGIRNTALGITQWIYADTAKAIESLVPLLPSQSQEVNAARASA